MRRFQKCTRHACRPRGCQKTSPQSPAIKRCLAGLALAQLGRAAAASAAPRQTFLLTWVQGCDLWSLVILQPFDLQSCMILFWKGHINICSDLKSQGPSMTQNKVSLMGKYVVLCYTLLIKRTEKVGLFWAQLYAFSQSLEVLAQKLSPPCPFQFWTCKECGSPNFCARPFKFWSSIDLI